MRYAMDDSAARPEETSPRTASRSLISPVHAERTGEHQEDRGRRGALPERPDQEPYAFAQTETICDGTRGDVDDYSLGGERPWRGFRHFEQGHKRVATRQDGHRSDEGQGLGGASRFRAVADGTGRLTAGHQGTGAESHANGAQKDPEHEDHSSNPPPFCEAHQFPTL